LLTFLEQGVDKIDRIWEAFGTEDGSRCHTILILRSRAMASCLGQQAAGSRQVKLIDGVAVPLLGGENPACQHGLRWVPTV
jgi:hypothetical protein